MKGARHMTGITCTLYALTDGVSAICLLFPAAAHRMGTVVHQASRISNICGKIERFVRGDIWLAMDPCVNQASQTTEQIKPWATICSISDIPRWCPSGEQVVPRWCPRGAHCHHYYKFPTARHYINYVVRVLMLFSISLPRGGAHVVPNWCPTGAQLVPKRCPGGAQVVTRWCTSGALVVHRWRPGGAQVAPIATRITPGYHPSFN